MQVASLRLSPEALKINGPASRTHPCAVLSLREWTSPQRPGTEAGPRVPGCPVRSWPRGRGLRLRPPGASVRRTRGHHLADLSSVSTRHGGRGGSGHADPRHPFSVFGRTGDKGLWGTEFAAPAGRGARLTCRSLVLGILLSSRRGGQVFGDGHGLVAVVGGIAHWRAFLP